MRTRGHEPPEGRFVAELVQSALGWGTGGRTTARFVQPERPAPGLLRPAPERARGNRGFFAPVRGRRGSDSGRGRPAPAFS
jgi:hypothetical protein